MKNTISRIIDYAVKVAEPDKVFLFGSMANGTNNVYSDLDLLLVMDANFPLKKQIIEQIKNYAGELMLPIDLLIHSEIELKNAASEKHSFLAGILSGGKLVYQKNM